MVVHLVPIWVRLRCGGCGQPFTGNARSVPSYFGSPACPDCWQRINARRVLVGLTPWEAPADAYPPPSTE